MVYYYFNLYTKIDKQWNIEVLGRTLGCMGSQNNVVIRFIDLKLVKVKNPG